MNKCRDCRYWERIEPTTKDGICHRFPPIPMVVPAAGGRLAMQSSFAMSAEGAYCGEWKGKGELQT